MIAPAAPRAVPRPDAVVDLRVHGSVHARCSLWWTTTPSRRGRRVGFIGALSARGDDALAELLPRAAERLHDEGCALAAGPVDGDTWHRYRQVIWSDGTPPFALEPFSAANTAPVWQRAGFTPLETYASFRDDELGERDARVPGLEARLRAAGVTLRPLDPARFDEELVQIHALALRGFAENALYTPIAFEPFAALYRPLLPELDPRLCPIAERDGRIVGVLFALRDPRDRGTVVLKTVVREPGRAFAGLGFVLTDRVRGTAHALGATRAISALQHDGSVARALAARGVVCRRYAVFAKERA